MVNPSLVVADEPVSALDVSIQAQILNLLLDLQSQYQLTYIFISHAMSVVRYVSNRICVMYGGKMVEVGDKTELLAHPKHPYTEVLLGAVPRPSSAPEDPPASDQGRAARPGQPAARLRFPPALPLCGRGL